MEVNQNVITNYEELKYENTRDGLDEEKGKEKAYALILPRLQKEFERIYMDRLLWMKQESCGDKG